MENCGNGIGYFDRIIEIICRGTLSDRRSRRIDCRTILGLGRIEELIMKKRVEKKKSADNK